MPDYVLTRRRVLGFGLGAAATMLLAACGDDEDEEDGEASGQQAAPTNTSGQTTAPAVATDTPAAAAPANTTAPEPTETTAASPAASPTTAGDDDVQVLVGDVQGYSLEPDGWEGPFGWVRLTIHPGHFDGGDVWFIRTDSSDQAHAEQEGLVFVPLLANALTAEGSYANIYLFEDGADGQGAVVSATPGDEQTYTPAFRVHRVTFSGEPALLMSEADILAAEADGSVAIEQTDIVVNYPLVSWPDGSLAIDDELLEPLGKGPLVEAIDTANATVTFKLHQCFPGSRYIVTDTSAVPMAPMMGVVGSGPTQMLKDANAVAPITIFLNGLTGPGVMGFQPAIFNESAGHPAWSPFWDHFAVEWADPSAATVVRSQAELDELVASGALVRYNGLPDTHPNGFVVNCPAPLLAPNTYEPT